MQGNHREILTQWYLCGLKLVLDTKLIFFFKLLRKIIDLASED